MKTSSRRGQFMGLRRFGLAVSAIAILVGVVYATAPAGATDLENIPALSETVAGAADATSVEGVAPRLPLERIKEVLSLPGKVNAGRAGHVLGSTLTRDWGVDPLALSGNAAKAASADTIPNCPHNVCVTGQKLDPGCSPCVKKICDVDPYCCGNTWDSHCVREVRTVCNSLVCSESYGNCPHSLCTQGGSMPFACDWTKNNCVSQICAKNPICCAGGWNADCVQAVTECIRPTLLVNTEDPASEVFCNCNL